MNILLSSLLACEEGPICTALGACVSHRSTLRLPESEQASRQARQEPDGMMVEARDDGLSGSGTDG